ncbi:ECF transporter S component [Anaeromicrobium sediminis]|nr:ECF transporter S component [Anaeromicrobium sediminis]
MKGVTSKKLTLGGVMAALVLVGTMIIQIPTPTKGYIHIGDSMVYLCGIFLGPVYGALAAAIGSFLADALSGYMVYAPATFVIKGLDAFVVGIIYYKIVQEGDSVPKRILGFLVAALLGGALMVGGYLVYESFLYKFETALLGVVGNITQVIGGAIVALPLLMGLEKSKVIQRYVKEF